MEWDLNPLLLLMNYDEIFSEQINELCCLYKNEITETINLTYDKVSIVQMDKNRCKLIMNICQLSNI